MRLTCRRNAFVLLALVVSLATGTVAHGQSSVKQVSPLLTGHYMPGIMSILDYADPAPASGLIVFDYNTCQFSNGFYGKDGKKMTEIIGPSGQLLSLNADVSGYYNTPMVLFVSKGKILGATYFGGASIPIVTVSTNLAYSGIGNHDSVHQSGDISGKVYGFSDLCILPLYLSWGLKNFDLTAGYMVYAPTGKYSTGGSNNTGLGFWSNIFQFFGFWYPEKMKGQPSKALAIMLGGTFELTSKMKDAEVKPGNRFSLDYGINQYVTDRFGVGLFGGNNWQVSADHGSDVYWDASVRDRIGVCGIQLGYWLWANRLQAVARYAFNYAAIEQFRQNMIELNLLFIADVLTGNKAAKAKTGK
jgi:hypothetical protein